ncbi:sugar ABC transporter permease [Heyndrickxia oleronia]|uniref:Sugar ABC transporter permease n=1 Tax=Heyndrickxia oleronia TaxID=38875 RepID=A0AAW6STH4_9BACI|nr:sugar ABC transporter permease [Heyndrickxia oleronia]MCM3238633.1 sugar ABC transporter permease [Heyndrickxia oleronia]MDH5162130.1 sugar ABC transporter permease [Heyndrickxia oleronia]
MSEIQLTTEPKPKRQAKRYYKTKKRSDYLWAYCMLAPTMIGLLIFYFWPILQTIYFSFTEWGAFGTFEWIGVENYVRMLTDSELGQAFRNTFIYIVLTVPIGIFLSILVAVLLNQKIKGRSVYRTLYFLPVITMPAAIAMVWKWLYNSDFGLINYVLSLFHIKGPSWITNPDIALYSIIIVAIWSGVGYNMVIFLSGLQNIPQTYYEAAKIDGAGPVRTFFSITMPLLSPIIFFVSIMSLIGAFQVFDLIFMMVSSNSVTIEKTQSIVYLFYQHAFVLNDKGYAAAIAVLLLVMILIVTVIQMLLQKKWVHYE